MTESKPAHPSPIISRERPIPWWWLLPLIALLIAGVAVWRSVAKGGTVIQVTFAQGHALAVGNDLRHRGIQVGVVEAIRLRSDAEAVEVRLRLQPGAQHLAREGSLFWVVRPQFALTGIAGLDTLIGSRYLAVLPGDGALAREFHGLDAPPVLADLQPGGLEITLEADQRGSIHPGSPLLYRQVAVGRVLSVGMGPDASQVLIRAYVEPPFRNLVRSNSRFWNASGITVGVGLGLSIEVDSLTTLLLGGIAFATPDRAGNEVSTGHRFTLAARAEDAWKAWRPSLLVGEQLSEQVYPLPVLQRSEIEFQRSSWGINRQRSTRGWVLVTDNGIVGCANTLTVPDAAAADSARISVAGMSFPLATPPSVVEHQLARIPLASGLEAWPQQRLRVPQDPEEVLLVGDPSRAPYLLSTTRMEKDDENGWILQRGVIQDRDWHGAVAVALSDGAIIAILDYSGSRGILRPLSPALIGDQP